MDLFKAGASGAQWGIGWLCRVCAGEIESGADYLGDLEPPGRVAHLGCVDGLGLVDRTVFVYLSGPITARAGFSSEENVAAALKVFLRLMRLGIPCFCPQLSAAFPSAFVDVSYPTWIAYSFAVIDRCTHVVMLDRWESSQGAVLEREYADAQGKPIVTVDELLSLLGKKAA